MVLNTTRDLADYARSTGPENDTQLPKPLASRPDTTVTTITASAGVHSDSVLPPPVPGSQPTDAARPSMGAEKPVHRLKYQARDARPARHAEQSDLIDFIREGPPRAPGEHRIDRNVAPFRNTMDSEDLLDIAPTRISPARISDGSAATGSVMAPSVQTSTHSRTGLLDPSNRNVSAPVSKAGAVKLPPKEEEDGMPKRTRQRVRDPYAIDESDDELEEESVQPKSRMTQDESLVDFLRNTAPPPGMTASPILSAGSVPDSAVKRAPSSAGLKDMLTRNKGNPQNGPSPRPPVREESPHLTQVGSKYDKYRPTQTTHAAHVDRNRQKPRMEVRDAVRSNGTTSDLADYLKNSGPSPGMQSEPPQRFVSTPIKEEAGFLKFFSRRRGSVKR